MRHIFGILIWEVVENDLTFVIQLRDEAATDYVGCGGFLGAGSNCCAYLAARTGAGKEVEPVASGLRNGIH